MESRFASADHNVIKGIPTHGRRYVQYNVYGNLFEVSRKYVPPIRPVGRGAWGIVCNPELVLPAEPTPREIKKLSDIDDQEALRFQVPVIFFYQCDEMMVNSGNDPAMVIREALSKALVSYYPYAGRMKEGPDRKLMVVCNGEGVLFVEATADVTLKQLGDSIQPPCPFLQEFLSDVPGSDGITDSPLFLIQVTRFLCGGFVLAMRHCHAMADAFGVVQFLTAVADFARGATQPSTPPVWLREVLDARQPPRITCPHKEYDKDDYAKGFVVSKNPLGWSNESFFFGPQEIKALKAQLPENVRDSCTRFELITACIWKCRTVALNLNPDEDVYHAFTVNMRGNRNVSVSIPSGYYGNAFVFPAVSTKAGALCQNSLLYAMKIVKKAKGAMTGDYIQSVADFMVINGRPGLVNKRKLFIVSDNTRQGTYDGIDFGWGRPVCGGPVKGFPGLTFIVSCKKISGEEGVVVPMCLPPLPMETFRNEVMRMTIEKLMSNL